MQDEYERETGSGTGGRGSEDLLSQVKESSYKNYILLLRIILISVIRSLVLQGRQWEESGEYQRAVECYLKIDALATRLVLLLLSAFVVVE